MISTNDWIPTASFIEYYVLNEAMERDVSLRVASKAVLPRFGMIAEGTFMHQQTRLLGMLYTLLVFPRERWVREGQIEVVVERALSDSELAEGTKKLLSPDFLRRLRNSVSHARVEFVDAGVTFRDGRHDSNFDFVATFSTADAVNLLLVLGRAFHESAQIKDTLSKFGGADQ